MKKVMKVLMFILIGLCVAALVTFIVMRLWNWLIPAVFGWHVITYWQALGILILSKILFGGFRGRPGPRPYWRHRMMRRWAQMTPEEREKFRESMRAGCGPFGASPAEPKL